MVLAIFENAVAKGSWYILSIFRRWNQKYNKKDKKNKNPKEKICNVIPQARCQGTLHVELRFYFYEWFKHKSIAKECKNDPKMILPALW